MTIALTGVSGQLGRLVVEELLHADIPADQIVAIVRDPAKVEDLAARGIQVRQGDYGRPEGWRETLRGIDRLLLISVSGAGASAAHRTVIDAAAEAGVGHLAYTSILNADRSTNPLAPEHYATERLIAASGIPHAILRNAWYHELYTRLLSEYLSTGEIAGSVGQGRISGAARGDFAAAAAAVLTADGTDSRIYELGGASFTFDDLAQILSEVAGRPIQHRSLTQEEHQAELEASGVDAGTAAFLVQNDASLRAGDMETGSRDLLELVDRPLRSLTESWRAVL